MAPRVGFEPTAIRLTVECSTAELSGSSPALAGQVGRICSSFCFGNPVSNNVFTEWEIFLVSRDKLLGNDALIEAVTGVKQ